jgi:hypothetical protein
MFVSVDLGSADWCVCGLRGRPASYFSLNGVTGVGGGRIRGRNRVSAARTTGGRLRRRRTLCGCWHCGWFFVDIFVACAECYADESGEIYATSIIGASESAKQMVGTSLGRGLRCPFLTKPTAERRRRWQVTNLPIGRERTRNAVTKRR